MVAAVSLSVPAGSSPLSFIVRSRLKNTGTLLERIFN